MTAATETSLELVVRFSTSNPDLVLTVDQPSVTSILSVKQQIRGQLPEPASASRLRLIHSGKALTDAAALSKSVNVTAPPPATNDESKSAKAKGKLPVRGTVAIARVYIHCSIGDALSSTELAAERKGAEDADSALLSKVQPTLDTTAGENAASTTTPAPRGFDRLLTAGFTATEVSQLRTQFLAIQSHSHTPDTMPSGAELLALEERWLDNTTNPATGAGDGAGEDDAAGGLEDMLWGNLIGFFWPIGAMMWLMREEGVWSRRRQIAVFSGFLVNVTFGFLRVMN